MKTAPGAYGYFDPAQREYVITRPDTPRPWFNYLMNGDFVSMISHTGGGVAYFKDPRVYRLLRYRYQNVPYDRPGRYVYIRDNGTGKYWSATWAPVWTKGGGFRCRVGANYQIITYRFKGIESTITYFVPCDRPLEIWDLTITNRSAQHRDLSTFSYAEFAFWGAMRDLMNIDNCPNVSRQKYDSSLGAILHYSWNDIGTGLHDMNFVRNYGFHLADKKPCAYNGDRDRFLGNYRDERDPLVVQTGHSTNYCENSGYPIGSLQHRFTLKPGESKRIVYQTGYATDEKAYRRTAAKYRDPKAVDSAFRELRRLWKNRFDAFYVQTPNREFNGVVNSFVQYQAAMTLVLSRSISSYEWGIGRAIGFRDSAQDQLGMMHAFPEKTRDMLIALCEGLFEDGSACHGFNPYTGHYGVGGFYDDHNWLALAVTAYIKETGDRAFLSKKVRYCKSKKTGSVLDHLFKAQDFAWKMRGKHGLHQIGCADWNDSLNPGDKRSESVFISLLYCASTMALIQLMDWLHLPQKAALFHTRYQTIKKLCNGIGWDGAWYKRLFKQDGPVIGSRRSGKWGYGTIFLEPQPWSVISGVAGRERGRLALNAVEEKLGTPHGHKIMDKPFTDYDPDIGSAGIYPPGIKENGSVFNHASSWMIYAEALLGRGDRAFNYFKRMAGFTKNRIAGTHEVEPYVACQFVSQKPFHIEGRGRNGWLTGTATWMALSAMQGILGCRPDYNGLIIDPCIPKAWTGFSLSRLFRGVRYDIEVKNPDKVSKGVSSLVVDGICISGNTIPFLKGKKTVSVTVVLGKKR